MKKEWCLPSPFGWETMKETKNPDIRKNKKETLFPTVVDNLLDKETHFCFMIWDKKNSFPSHSWLLLIISLTMKIVIRDAGLGSRSQPKLAVNM